MAAVELGLVRWSLFEDAPQLPKKTEVDRLGDLATSVSMQYRQSHDWSFPADDARRKAWLRNELARLQIGRSVEACVPSTSPILGYRIGLLDKDKRYLAGAVANRFMIADL